MGHLGSRLVAASSCGPQLLLPACAAQRMHSTTSHQAGASGEPQWCCPAAGLNDTSMLLYNNLLSLPVMLSYMVMATDELLEVHRFPLLWDMKFQVRPKAKRVPATFCNPSSGCTSAVNSCRLPALPCAAELQQSASSTSCTVWLHPAQQNGHCLQHLACACSFSCLYQRPRPSSSIYASSGAPPSTPPWPPP